MSIPTPYCPPKHDQSCPYCRLRRSVERARAGDELAELEAPATVLGRLGRLVTRRG